MSGRLCEKESEITEKQKQAVASWEFQEDGGLFDGRDQLSVRLSIIIVKAS